MSALFLPYLCGRKVAEWMITMSNEIQSVARVFAIIEHLSNSPKAQPLKVIASPCAIPPPTAHRFLNNLCSLGYVIREDDGRYKLSYKLFEISSKALNQSSVISIAKPYLDDMSERLGESVHLVVKNGNDVVYVYKITRAIGSIQMASKIGMRLPMYRCAVGKALLAEMDDKKIEEVFRATEVVAVTQNTITEFDKLMEQIQIVRDLDYAVDNEENENGVICVASALTSRSGEAKYAFSISTLTSRVTKKRMQELVSAVLETKHLIEERI